jgi:hypothetical protein
MLDSDVYRRYFSDSSGKKVMDIAGLILSFVGAIIIFTFGLPPNVRESGKCYLLLEQEDKHEIKKGRRYRKISRLGLILLALGFLLQLLERII